ncbi:MAG TPA: hypothetical protein EYQ14_30200, partial [Gammaproteobacteria bacterium]|nr:hypothetical protein [Gammaproteobacteria bacterium]
LMITTYRSKVIVEVANGPCTPQADTILNEKGVLVVPDVVPEPMRSEVISAIIEFSGISLADAATWYQPNFAGHGIVPLHHHQALWNVRQYPEVHEIFSDLYDSNRLWVSMDRVSYKPPASPVSRDWSQSPVHWDCDPWQVNEISLQGLVYLTDTQEDQGAFACVPSIYADLDNYLAAHKNEKNRREPKFEARDLISVAGSAGTLVIWNRLMPHTSGLNRSGEHRFVQYVAMQQTSTLEENRQQRIREWKNKMPPEWAIHQRIGHQLIPEPGLPAVLSELGEKLVGLRRW